MQLCGLVRNLFLSKEKAKLLSSKLQQWNLLQVDDKDSSFRNRIAKLSSFYKFEGRVCNYPAVTALIKELETENVAKELRLFIDSCKVRLKAVL